MKPWRKVCTNAFNTDKHFDFHLALYLVIFATGTKAKNQKVTMRISTCKMLSIRRTLAVKDCTMSLSFNLKYINIQNN